MRRSIRAGRRSGCCPMNWSSMGLCIQYENLRFPFYTNKWNGQRKIFGRQTSVMFHTQRGKWGMASFTSTRAIGRPSLAVFRQLSPFHEICICSQTPGPEEQLPETARIHIRVHVREPGRGECRALHCGRGHHSKAPKVFQKQNIGQHSSCAGADAHGPAPAASGTATGELC